MAKLPPKADTCIPPSSSKARSLKTRPAPPVRHGAWSLFSNKGNLTALIALRRRPKRRPRRAIPAQRQPSVERGHHRRGRRNAWRMECLAPTTGLLRQKMVTYRDGTLDGPFEAYYGSGGRLSQGSIPRRCRGRQLEVLPRRRAPCNTSTGTARENLIETIRVNGTFHHVVWRRASGIRSQLTGTRSSTALSENGTTKAVLSWKTFTDADTGEELQRRVMQGVQVSREGEYVTGQARWPGLPLFEHGAIDAHRALQHGHPGADGDPLTPRGFKRLRLGSTSRISSRICCPNAPSAIRARLALGGCCPARKTWFLPCLEGGTLGH